MSQPAPTQLNLGGERLVASYRLQGDSRQAKSVARAICIEQTVEFPADLIRDPEIRDQVIGRIEDLTALDAEQHLVRISFAAELASAELPQLLNLLFGNISMQTGVRLIDIELPPRLREALPRPGLGGAGIRSRLDAPRRPLLCSALKPMGMSAGSLAQLAHQLALGGIDVIKDDHGLADQPFCPFNERVDRCAEAVQQAVRETGKPCLYAPNVTAPADRLKQRARHAKQAGAGALLIAPGLTGLDGLGLLARDREIDLPLLCHPALLGSFTLSPHQGIAPGLMYGLLPRLAGADATIFPHPGGRFALSTEDCQDILDAVSRPIDGVKPIMPVPAGGLTRDRVDELREFYGDEMMLLIGGDLHHEDDLLASCRAFAKSVQKQK